MKRMLIKHQYNLSSFILDIALNNVL